MSPGGYNTTIENWLIDPGDWRAASASDKVLACYNFDAFKEGLTSAPEYCRQGYGGPCKRFYAFNTTYARTFGYECPNTQNMYI